ncbi:c-type cytochrome [Arenibaculum pallidiluteum]|uniref:c-type cytochrome n=1 Tax=Arenibaculum pallidiluteum TaxID=2812559 RepID=UPI001A957468|nr:c-type cytochrome [Arenibaculum pallidiluteum]
MAGVFRTIAAVLACQAAGAFLFAWSGLYDIGASAGHWAVTRWFLEFGMRNSIETHAMGLGAPDLDDIALIQRGAGHYEGGCAPCHGAPGAPQGPIAAYMLPAPPYLPDEVAAWKPEELYWITRHGVKYAGMPAWPAPQRDDEPWALAAFLVRLDGMKPEEYRRLAFGEDVPPDRQSPIDDLAGPAGAALQGCARCHGYDGLGRGTGAFPRLAGQNAAYLQGALDAYASGARPSGIMKAVAAVLSAEDRRVLAEYYARQPSPSAPPRGAVDAGLVERGRALALAGDLRAGVAPCASCHGPGHPTDPRFPRLAGQHARYIADQLRLWQQGKRGDTALSGIMAAAVRGITEPQVQAVAAYYASLPPGEDLRADGQETGHEAPGGRE